MSQPEQQQQAQPAGKKGKKKKGTTLSLNDFLGDAPPPPVTKSLDWADESEEFDGPDLQYQSSYSKKMLSNLPTGPRASRTIEVDMSKLPDEPPFTAFVGNLPYEADEQMLMDFFKDLKVLGVRLPNENGRFKGYGYVEFEDKHSLAQALQHNEETFNKRQIRVDVAGSKNQGDNRRGNRGYGGQGFGMSGFDGPDVTEGDWRRKPDESLRPQSSNRGYDERDSRSDQGGYDSSYRSRDGYGRSDYYGDRRNRGYGESDYRSDRGFYERYQRDDYDRYDSGGRQYGKSGYYRERHHRDYQRSDSYGRDNMGHSRDQDYGYNQGYSGDRGGYGGDRGGDRGYNEGRNRDYYRRDQGNDGYDRGYGGSRDRYSDDRSYGGGSRGYGGRDYGYSDRSYGGDGRSGGYGDRYDSRDGDYGRDRYQNQDTQGPERRYSEENRDEPPARRQLNLRPRTKPLDTAAPAEGSARSSIFGGAKPVDTAAREKQIEEKLKQEQESVFQLKDERDTHKRAPRRSSEMSDEGHPSSPQRRSRRTSSDKDYKDSQRRRSTSPGHQPDETSPKDEQPQRDYKPAPIPKQSAWSKPSAQGPGARKPSGSEDAAEVKKSSVRPAPAPATNQWSRGPPKLDNRGVREEAEGNAKEDDMNERTPEGAADDVSRGSNGSAGDGSEQRRSGPNRRSDEKPRSYGDGRRDEVGRGHRQPYGNQSDYRRRGDGGSGKRQDWDRERQGGYDDGKSRQYSDRRRSEEDRKSRGDSSKKGSQEKRRDSSRDSRPECDRSAAVGQEQDCPKGLKGKRQPKGPPELEPEPVIEFVQKSKFSALAIDDDEDGSKDEVSEAVPE